MNWLGMAKALGFYGASQVLLFILIGFLGKWVFEYFAGHLVDLRKNELAKEIESYKNQLDRLKLEHQVQFSGLYEKRFGIIAELYAKLVKLNAAMVDLTQTLHIVVADGEEEEQERITHASTSYEEFVEYYRGHKIYFQEEVCALVDGIIKKYWVNLWDSTEYRRRHKFQLSRAEIEDIQGKATLANRQVREEIPQTLALLEQEFRAMLGVRKVV